MAGIAISNNPSNAYYTNLETRIQIYEHQKKTDLIARVVLYSLGAVFALASVAIGFFSVPFLSLTIPIAVILFISAITYRGTNDPGSNSEDLRHILQSRNKIDLIQRYSRLCKALDLSTFDTGVDMATVRKWLFSQCSNPEVLNRLDALFPLFNPDAILSLSVFNEFRMLFKRLQMLNDEFGRTNDANRKNMLTSLYVPAHESKAWFNLPNKLGNISNDKLVYPENIAIFIAASPSLKQITLGQCITPDIIRACGDANVESISLETYPARPIFHDVAQEIIALPKLKKLTCNLESTMQSAKTMIESHFKQTAPYSNEYVRR